MPVRVDVVHRQNVELGWTELINCSKCKTRWKAGVNVRATGEGRAPYGIGSEGAKEVAGIDAFSNASEEGRRLIRLAKCPRCQHRDASLWTVWALARGFLAAMIVAMVPMLLAALSPKLEAIGCLLGVPTWFGGTLVIAKWLRRKEFAEADRVVVFEKTML